MNVLMIAAKSKARGSSMRLRGMARARNILLPSLPASLPPPPVPPPPEDRLLRSPPGVSAAEGGLKGDSFFFLSLVPRPRRTEFRALSPRCNPALNIQKRDRPAKRLPRNWSGSWDLRRRMSAQRMWAGEVEGFSYANWHSSFSYGAELKYA